MAGMPTQEIADRLEIAQVLYTYVDALDARDWDRLSALFTDDATLDYSGFGGPSGSVADAVAWLEPSMQILAMTQHHITNHLISIDADEARVRSALYNPMAMDDGDGGFSMMFAGGYYNDRFVRTPDGWRIAERAIEAAWFQTKPLPASRGAPGV